MNFHDVALDSKVFRDNFDDKRKVLFNALLEEKLLIKNGVLMT